MTESNWIAPTKHDPCHGHTLLPLQDNTPPEARELDLFKLSAPRVGRGAQGKNTTWWTVDARAPEPEPVLDNQLERALSILTQIVGMKLLAVSEDPRREGHACSSVGM